MVTTFKIMGGFHSVAQASSEMKWSAMKIDYGIKYLKVVACGHPALLVDCGSLAQKAPSHLSTSLKYLPTKSTLYTHRVSRSVPERVHGCRKVSSLFASHTHRCWMASSVLKFAEGTSAYPRVKKGSRKERRTPSLARIGIRSRYALINSAIYSG